MNFNYDSPQNIYSVNQINQSNIPLNPRTYDTVKKQIAINSDFRKKILKSLEDQSMSQRTSCCDDKVQHNNDNESTSNFTVELSEPIDNVVSLELVSSEIPLVQKTYSDKKNNNKFIIRINSRLRSESTNTTNDYLIKIPDGIFGAGQLQTFLNNNCLSYYSITDNSKNYLAYLKFEIIPYMGKMSIRFKNLAEIRKYNIDSSNSLLPYNEIPEDFYYELLNFDNLNSNKSYVNIDDYNYSVNSNLSLVNGEDKCKNNNRINFVQGFTDINISINDDSFKFTTLGTIGFTEDNIYETLGNILIPKKHYFKEKQTLGFTIYRGLLIADNIYGSTIDSGMYIRVNDFIGNRGEQIIINGKNQTQITANVLSRISIKNGIFSNNISNAQQDYNIKRNYFGGVRITKLQIQIVDKYGMIIDLQNYPTNFIFEFTQEYSSERLSNFRNRM